MREIPVVILAGGFGTRFSEETIARPKPMIEIGGKPILYHIMSQYSVFGVRKFIVLTGYKSEVIKNYFLNFASINSDFQVNTRTGSVKLDSIVQDWDVHIAFTGLDSNTGERLRLAEHLLRGHETFFLTYGDGLSNVNHQKAMTFHLDQKRLLTITAVNPPGRFGSIRSKDGLVEHWGEKSIGSDGLVSGGFFVVQKEVLQQIPDTNVSLESNILPSLVRKNQVSAFEHFGFWQCMDTQRDRERLEQYARDDVPPWLIRD